MRMNDLEETNFLLKKLDLTELITPEKLEDRIQYEIYRIDKAHSERA